MQSFRSRSVSSEMQPRISPSAPTSRRSVSPSLRKSSHFSSNSNDSRPSSVSERKISPKSQSFGEKQRPLRLCEMQDQWVELEEDLRKIKEERSFALQELEELKKKKNEESLQTKDTINMLQLEAEKAKESELKMLESLSSQTKQLEQTKISLEEAKLEIRNLPRSSSKRLENNASLASSNHATEEIRKLRNELRLALEAEEKSKKAMDDLAIALKEVTIESTQAKLELAATKSELETTEKKLQDALMQYHKLKQENEESVVSWKDKEDSFINCVKISEEDMNKKDKELIRLTDSHRMAREETSKLRDIIKQSINDGEVIKESLAIARYQKFELEEQMSKKENALQQIKQDYESIKVSEAAALDSVRELKSMLASVFSDTKSPNLSEFESFLQSKSSLDDRKISPGTKKFSSDRWMSAKPMAQQNGHRHSVGEADVGLPSFLFSDDRGLNTDDFDHLNGMLLSDSESEKKKKKKTALQKFGDVFMRRSVRKT